MHKILEGRGSNHLGNPMIYEAISSKQPTLRTPSIRNDKKNMEIKSKCVERYNWDAKIAESDPYQYSPCISTYSIICRSGTLLSRMEIKCFRNLSKILYFIQVILIYIFSPYETWVCWLWVQLWNLNSIQVFFHVISKLD